MRPICLFGVVLFEERRRTFGPVRNVFRVAWSPPAGSRPNPRVAGQTPAKAVGWTPCRPGLAKEDPVAKKKDGKPTAAQKAKAQADAKQVIARNKKARHEYSILDTYEAGMSLTGTEVKALRLGRASLVDAWVEIDRYGEAWLHGANIPVYAMGTWTNHAPTRKRKLLLHKQEIGKLMQKVQSKGLTIVPLELYFLRGRAKVEIALAEGKQEWDKRETIRRRDADRYAERAMAAARRRSRS